MNRAAILAVALASVIIGGVMATGLTAVWLTEEVRVFGLVMLSTAVVASLLVLYFDWRGRMTRHLRAEPDAHQASDAAAWEE